MIKIGGHDIIIKLIFAQLRVFKEELMKIDDLEVF